LALIGAEKSAAVSSAFFLIADVAGIESPRRRFRRWSQIKKT